MTLESVRLRIFPAENREMEALIRNEKDPALRQAYGEMLEGCLRDPENREWYAVWYMEPKDRPSAVIGDLCFKGPPENGAVEIGYGLREGFCGKGYMTEAVRALAAWALSQPGVAAVEAETEPDNTASQRVLLRVGFVPTGETGREGPRYVLR